MTLSNEELQRYARHLVLPQVGEAGQARLRAASVLIIGLGGLGSPAALYLAAAGIGRLGLLDDDDVALHNLQRQVLHDSASVGRAKTDSARARVEALNPHVTVDTWRTRLTAANARAIVRDYDVVLDGTDRFAARYLVNDACVLERVPCVQASVHRFEGQVSVFATTDGPCYRCLHPEPPPAGAVPDCAQGGVLGALPGLLGTLQAVEALKLVLGIGEPLAGRLLAVDALAMRFRVVDVPRDPECAWCARRTATTLLDDYAEFCGEGDPAVPSAGAAPAADEARSIAPRALAARAPGAVAVLDVREPWELGIVALPGALHIPMSEVPARLGTLDRRRTWAVLCHHGTRSAMVAEYLRTAGFPRVLNIEGGIDRWSREVDPALARY